VSLLRPEIIRDLQLPKHGLDILPLDGTFTPLLKGDGPPAGGASTCALATTRPDDRELRALVAVDARRRDTAS